ncbi:MAG: hypothetical protein ACP5JP_04075 [bacterium]
MNQEEIEKLLQDGLALYGYGKIEQAVAIWKKVLELDPNNTQAIDYIESAGFAVEPKTPLAQSIKNNELDTHSTEFVNLNYLRGLLKSRRYELAYEFLEKLSEKQYPFKKQVIGYLAIVKAQLIKLYYNELQDLKGIPRLSVNEQELVRYNLDKTDGYIISMIDGYSTIDEILQMISSIDRFETMKRFYKLKKLGVIGF